MGTRARAAAPQRAAWAAPSGAPIGRPHRHGHRQGRRPRHRQEHRGRRARMQRLRGHRPGRHGARYPHPGEAGAEHVDLTGSRAHHALARGDARRRHRDGAGRLARAAAHRRRHDLASTYGRQDGAAYCGPVIHVEDASRAVGVVGARLTRRRGMPSSRTRADEPRPGAATRSARDRIAVSAWMRHGPARPSTGARRPSAAAPDVPGHATLADLPIVDLIPWIDWTPFFGTWELHGRYPQIRRRGRGPRPLTSTRMARMLHRWPTKRCCGPRPWWASGRLTRPPRTTSSSARTRAAGGSGPLHTLRQQMVKLSPTDPTWPWPTSWRALDSDLADYLVSFAVTAGIGWPRLVRASRPPTTTTRPSSARPSPTVWPRPSRSGSSSCDASCGATR